MLFLQFVEVSGDERLVNASAIADVRQQEGASTCMIVMSSGAVHIAPCTIRQLKRALLQQTDAPTIVEL
jgi:hypothetical protein